jgi:hypothetical protein
MRRTGFNLLSRVTLVIAFAAVVSAQLIGCSEPGGELHENQSPTVWLSSAPPEGSVESYTIKMFWGGWDPDGEIAYYEYCITDNLGGSFDPADTTGPDRWDRVYSNDSTFSFTADVLVDSIPPDYGFAGTHTFFIRAIDTEGLASVAPAYRSFTAFTLAPEVDIQIPVKNQLNPAEVPPITTFRWDAVDFISNRMQRQDPDSVTFLLEPIGNHNDDWMETLSWLRNLAVDAPEWGGWRWYKAPEDSGKFWTTPPKDQGSYMFAIRAKDEAGAVTPVLDEERNVRRLVVSTRTTGPILTVRNQYLGSVNTAVCNTPLVILDLPAGIPVEFSWEADASSYGGTEAGYRYGWDITDLNDPSQWEFDYAPFPWRPEGEPASARTAQPPRQFYFGTHVFTIEVVDNSGYCSRVEVKVNIVQFTMDNDLLLVDDFPESEWGGWWHLQGKGVEPTDEQHDEFWEQVLSNVSGFNPTQDVVDGGISGATTVPLTKLALYKSIIWSAKGNRMMSSAVSSVVHDLIKFRPKSGPTVSGKQQPNLIALFMAAGGHVLYCGQHPMSLAIDRSYVQVAMRYPAMYKYDLDQRSYRQDVAPTPTMVQNPPGDESFPYFEMCLETIDYAVTSVLTRRPPGYHCPVNLYRWVPDSPAGNAEYVRTRSMRGAIPLDADFPRLELRPETAAPGKYHDPNVRGLDVEVYNPQYFFESCISVRGPRDCFQPIYGLDCFETSEPTYGGAIAFWTSEFEDVVAAAPGAVGARSVVLGFPPVLCDTLAVRGALETILFDEWQLPRK